MTIDERLVQTLAGDAFDVLNWARHLGLKRDKQIEQLASAFRQTFAQAGVSVAIEPLDQDRAAGSAG